MSAKGSCIVNDKVMVSVKNEKLMRVNSILTVGLLRSFYEQHERNKLFAKSILTTPANICYNNVELKALSVKKADKNKDLILIDRTRYLRNFIDILFTVCSYLFLIQ